MPMNDDTPRIWTGSEYFEDEMPQESTELAPIPEEPPLPSIAEQRDLVKNSDLTDENKGILNALVEINNTAQLLAQIHNEETKELQSKLIEATCTTFIQARMTNNAVAEKLKASILENLLENIGVLDLQTQAEILNNLTEVSAIDAQQALARMQGGSGGMPGGGTGINLTINNATAEGAAITTNTMNVGGAAPVTQLKEVASLNNSVRSWSQNAPMPKRVNPTVQDAEVVNKD